MLSLSVRTVCTLHLKFVSCTKEEESSIGGTIVRGTECFEVPNWT